MASDSPASAPERELRELRQRLRSGNADLYRHLALYLQVLRQVLPVRVERAAFHMATQIRPQRYTALPPEERHQFHQRLSGLVHRCSSLLTVEQLCSLASQMALERRRQEKRQRRLLLHRLSADGPRRAAPLPVGSVDLDRPPSFSAGLLSGFPLHGGFERATEAELSAARDAAEPVDAADLQAALESLAGSALGHAAPPVETRQSSQQEPHGGHADPEAEDPAEAENPLDEEDPFAPLPELPGLPALAPLLQQWLAETPTAQPSLHSISNPWGTGELPDEPQLLLRWLEGVERALARRLRNLSHAINVELLRVGICSSLLPVSLLDAVLAGQIEPQPAPPNLLRLPLPLPSNDASPSQLMVLLLRSVDLELEEPRLRTCRRRLQQHRQEVRRMAQQFRRLQRRREAHEAEQLWLQDRHISLSPPA
ncbi:MAG: hypothetical protein VKJ05_07880 [Synechococcaceae cyanobacterium]|nr:hypothetical protein [Synechococcaceae cyanobacterium]